MTGHMCGDARKRQAELAIVAFNDRCPIGTPVLYWPGVRKGEGKQSVTRSQAWLLGGHTPVVMLEGYPGGIALTHIETRGGGE